MTAAEITRAPSREELRDRAISIVPTLRENAQWNEENRRLHPDTLSALAEAGVFRMAAPARFGGYECDFTTQAEVITEITRGDGATGWASTVWAGGAWLLGLFGDEALEEMHTDLDVPVSGILSPTATATPTEGGVLVSGRWPFNTGSLHAGWDVVSALRPTEAGGMEPVMVAIPISELDVVDDWHTAGLRGTGSVTRTADAVFVPERRVQAISGMLDQNYATTLSGPNWRAPLATVFAVLSGPAAVGIARAAMESFLERLPGRKITYTDYEAQSAAPLTHLQVADARMKLDEAEFHAARGPALVDRKTAGNEAWTTEERCLVRTAAAYACRRAKEVVDILNSASGASSIYQNVPMQRYERDVQTINLHAMLNPNTNQELYGRVLCGLAPNSPFI